MKRVAVSEMRTYRLEGKYFCEVIHNTADHCFDVWVGNDDIGTKVYYYGLLDTEETFDSVEEFIEQDESDMIDSFDTTNRAQERGFSIEDYENDPEVQYGWYQQDMIDLRHIER